MIVQAETPLGAKPTIRDASIRFKGFDVAVVPELRVLINDESRDDFEIDIGLDFSLQALRYTVTSLTVYARGGQEVSGSMLRKVRVLDYQRIAARSGIFLRFDRDDPPASLLDHYGPEGMFGAEAAKVIAQSGPTETVLHLVARSYLIAMLSSQPPAKAVERDFRLPARTAAHWISKASGLLPQLVSTPDRYENDLAKRSGVERTEPTTTRFGLDRVLRKEPETWAERTDVSDDEVQRFFETVTADG